MFFILLNGFTDDVNADDLVRVDSWDNSKVEYRHPSFERMDAYKNMSDYKYDRYKKPETLWDRIKRWIIRQLFDVGIQSYFIVYVLIGIVVFILLIIILKILGVKPSGVFLFKQDPSVAQLNFQQADDDIYGQDLDKMLKINIRNGAYREAVRLMYLICIRSMDQSHWIEWKPWKTNHDYFYDLKDENSRAGFKNIVINYEYVWYGQFAIGELEFMHIKESFDTFQKSIKSN